MPREVKTEQDCRLIYGEILKGFSYDKSGKFILRHYTELDLADTELSRRRYLIDGAREGLISEKDKLSLLQEMGHWSVAEEDAYLKAKEEVDSLHYSLKRLIVPQQIEHMRGLINTKQKEFDSQFGIRAELLGTNLEQYAQKRSSEYHIFRSFFKDETLTVPMFSQDDIDDLTHNEVSSYVDIYYEIHEVFFEKNFKKVAVCPFFLNGYNLAEESPLSFYGKPIKDLTLYQLALFHRGKFYKNILSNPECKTPPEESYSNLDDVIKFYDRQYSIMLGKMTNNQLIH